MTNRASFPFHSLFYFAIIIIFNRNATETMKNQDLIPTILLF